MLQGLLWLRLRPRSADLCEAQEQAHIFAYLKPIDPRTHPTVAVHLAVWLRSRPLKNVTLSAC